MPDTACIELHPPVNIYNGDGVIIGILQQALAL